MSEPHRVSPIVGPSALTRRYRGGCLCGCVVYEVSLDLTRAHAAAPSVWERPVAPAAFKLLRGEEMLRGYQFSDAGVHHFFCDRCGVRSFSHHDSPTCGEFYSVDLKCLHVGAPSDSVPCPLAS
jgi:hypothetical protein